jgi:hypothetical protein
MFLRFFSRKDKDRGAVAGSGNTVVDAAMYYCHGCGGEFRYFMESCPSCGAVMESGSDRLARLGEEEKRLMARPLDIPPGSETIPLRKGQLREMKEVQRVLARQRIPSLLGGEDGDCRKGCCGPELTVMIRPEDVDLALRTLAEEFVRTTSVDCHQLSRATAVFDARAAEVLCPACGCRFSPTVGACPDCGLSFE